MHLTDLGHNTVSNLQKLNNIDHAKLKVITSYSSELGDSTMFSLAFPNEMRALQSCYPLLFFRDKQTERFLPVALHGFEENENLFLDAYGWQAPVIPMMVQRGPFMLSIEQSSGGQEGQTVVAIDVDHPKTSENQGEPLFLEHGGHSGYLDRVVGLLEAVKIGNDQIAPFVDKLHSLELITPIELKITLDNGTPHQLVGFYSIDDEKLQTLATDELTELHHSGWLLPTYMMLASMSQLKALIARKNTRTK